MNRPGTEVASVIERGTTPMTHLITTADTGPARGPIRYGPRTCQPIGVIEIPTPPGSYEGLPSGLALPLGPDPQGRAIFRLVLRGEPLPGRWIVESRAFVEVDADG
jgi:hypothetical protein